MADRVVCIIQARMGSSRLPRKVLAEIQGRPVLKHVFDRAQRIEGVDAVVLATTVLPDDAVLVELTKTWGFASSVGAVDDVLDRYWRTALIMEADVVVRVTADCPLLDPLVSGAVVRAFSAKPVDYASNVHPPTYPDGLDTEVIGMAALERAWNEARLPSEREHVTPFIWKRPSLFQQANVEQTVDRSALRWTVDDAEDLAFVQSVYENWGTPEGPPDQASVLELLSRVPQLLSINSSTPRNEGYARSLDQDHVGKAIANE
jgi:spore coat polysaccharide biosynthesis protein SpsF